MRRRGVLVKLDDDLYVEWSSVVDAPVAVMNRDDALALLAREVEEAREALRVAQGALPRLFERGHTALWTDVSPERYVVPNRAGPDESQLTFGELRDRCRRYLDGDRAAL